jgi:tetratricopeptide (TPR) repeat protein
MLIAGIEEQQGHYEAALTQLNTILSSIHPPAMNVRERLVTFYFNRGQQEKALDECEKILEIDPTHKHAKEALIHFKRRQPETKKQDGKKSEAKHDEL